MILTKLRKLQSGRTIHEQLQDQKPTPKPGPAPGLPNTGFPNMDALMAMADHQLARQYREQGMSSFCNPVGQAPDLPPPPASFCNPNPTQPAVSKNIPRNAPCPCRSGAKYKKCCGGPAASAPSQAA